MSWAAETGLRIATATKNIFPPPSLPPTHSPSLRPSLDPPPSRFGIEPGWRTMAGLSWQADTPGGWEKPRATNPTSGAEDAPRPRLAAARAV